MSILQVIYILTSFILICGATVIYNGNRRDAKHRAFALLFVFMALWQQSALLITLVPPDQAESVFTYGLLPLLLGSFMVMLHAVYLITGIYKRKYAVLFKLLFLPPILNVLLFPLEGWLYTHDVTLYNQHSPPGPGGFFNFGTMIVYMTVIVVLLLPQVRRRHRPSQIWLAGMTLFVLWALGTVILGELIVGSWDPFNYVPLGINFWAAAVYITVYKYNSLPSFERRYNILFDKAPIGIMIIDSEAVIVEASPRAAQAMGRPIHKLIGHSLFDWYDEQKKQQQHREYLDNFNNRRSIQQYEISFPDPLLTGQIKYLAVSSDFIEMEGEVYQLLMIADITETKKRDKQIHDLAYYDQLTGLHNRVSFQQFFKVWQHEKRRFALVILDLNDFKSINDQYGHLVGDQALKHFGEQLKASVRQSDFVARLSGDEFVIMLSADEDVPRVTDTIRGRLLQPIELGDGVRLEMSTSIGVAVYPRDGNNMDNLFKAADDRMYEDKRQQQEIR